MTLMFPTAKESPMEHSVNTVQNLNSCRKITWAVPNYLVQILPFK